MFKAAFPLAYALALVSPLTAPAPLPSDAPLSVDEAGLRRFIAAAKHDFAGLAASPQAQPTGLPAGVSVVANLSDTQSCVVTPPQERLPARLSCSVYGGGDLALADAAYAKLARTFASLTGVAGVDHTEPSRFLVSRTDTFAMPDGTEVVLSSVTRIDPHARLIDFTIMAPRAAAVKA